MSPIEPSNRLIVIVGPTAVGKTETAIQLAEQFDGEIVSGDSRLFYRGMDIGTAKPTLEERQRVPHHLIDVADPTEVWSLGVFKNAAKRAIAGIHARNRLPFLVGGTGQYITALIEDWSVPPQQPDTKLREVLEGWAQIIGNDAIYHKLAILDPQAAKNIDPRNLRRTIRALEVILKTGKRFSEQRLKGESPYRVLKIGLKRPRQALYQRIDQRIDQMLKAGLVDEVKNLLERGLDATSPVFSTIGYREIAAYLQGKITLDEAIGLIKKNTRQFVRRQANWFKEHDPQIHWFDMNEKTTREIADLIHGWLKEA
ncbi:tRNA dimethylallyltransferase [Bellilinea caldifistulae]|uniref:tRNA dimethylallyltransferase n=1 Tax=Bellilinea caldifistulae TaxID=360411 RepID=A0A0P6X3E6_9CHLR|nr:tRNA (adenosine(37)-N6)-dimethylallyltransferase MiaA [Bellilinea caldifistulae]KPL73918.1 tRNA delta(2)-isopentenylpyrophosphate transferase [Bellilinea caldifistulae]GAP11211.1 tRNA dimethylallyltransferase [Bellilinea caldifistulae]